MEILIILPSMILPFTRERWHGLGRAYDIAQPSPVSRSQAQSKADPQRYRYSIPAQLAGNCPSDSWSEAPSLSSLPSVKNKKTFSQKVTKVTKGEIGWGLTVTDATLTQPRQKQKQGKSWMAKPCCALPKRPRAVCLHRNSHHFAIHDFAIYDFAVHSGALAWPGPCV
jgi:hypothetical protein